MAPAARNREQSEQVAGLPQAVPRGRVLLVDEDGADLNYYRLIIQEQGYEVRPCGSYEEGVRCLETERFDFVVVNQGSRAFEGRRVLERVNEIDRRTPVLILTRSVDIGCYLDAMQLGAVDYLEKPLAPSEVARVLQTHFRPRRTSP